MIAVSTPAGATTGSWERISAYNSGLVVTVPSPHTTNNLQVETQPYGAMAYNCQWMFTDAGAGTVDARLKLLARALPRHKSCPCNGSDPHQTIAQQFFDRLRCHREHLAFLCRGPFGARPREPLGGQRSLLREPVVEVRAEVGMPRSPQPDSGRGERNRLRGWNRSPATFSGR